MAGAIYKALTDECVRERCPTTAASVAKQFSAQTMIEQTIAVYEQAAALHASQRCTSECIIDKVGAHL
jgi:hypothetical protein